MALRIGRTAGGLFRLSAALFAGLVLISVAAILALTNTPLGRQQLRNIATGALRGSLHGIVHIGSVDGDLLDHLVLTDVSVTDSSGAPFLTVRRVEVWYSILDLLRRRVYLRDVRLDSATVVMAETTDHRWNYDRVFPSSDSARTVKPSGWGSRIRLTRITINDADLTIRSPWEPDSTLKSAARDSAIRAATAPDSRLELTAVPGGYEQTIAFHRVNGKVAQLDLANPDRPFKTVRVDALSAQLALFRPPSAMVRDLAGTFYLDSDSLWWSPVTVARPPLRLDGHGAYRFTDRSLTLGIHLDSVAFADLRSLDPHLPANGSITGDGAITWRSWSQSYDMKRLSVISGAARVTGRVGVTIGDSLSFHDTDLQFAGIDSPILSELIPGVDLPGRGIAHGRAIVSGGPHALALDADVTYEDPVAGPSRVTAVGEVGLLSSRKPPRYRARHLAISIDPLSVALAHEAFPSLPIRGAITGHLTLDGSTAASLNVTADLVHRDGPVRSHLITDGMIGFSPDRGVRPTSVDLQARTDPLDLRAVGAFVPSAHLTGAVSGIAHVSGGIDDLTIHFDLAVVGSPDSGALEVDGHLDLSSPQLGYDLTVSGRHFDARSVVGAAPHTTLTATASARGHGLTPATLASTLRADLGASVIAGFALDSARLRAAVGGGLLHLDTLLVRAAATTADVRGEIGLDEAHPGTLTYHLAIDSLGVLRDFLPRDTESVAERREPIEKALARARVDSARRADSNEVERAIRGAPPPALVVDTLPTLRRDFLAGRAVANGTVVGAVGQFAIRGDLSADSVIAWGNSARRVRALYAGVVQGNHWMPAAATVALRNATIDGFAVDSADVRATYRSPEGTLDLAVYQDSLRDYRLNSQFHYTPTVRELRYDSLAFRFDTTIWAAPQPGTVRWTPDRIEVNHFELTSGASGRILVDGVFPLQAGIPATLRATVHDLDVGDVRTFVESDLPMRGRLSMQADLSGSADAPHLQGNASLADARVRSTPLPDAVVTFRYDTATFHANAQLAPTGAPGVPFAQAEATVPIRIVLGSSETPLHEGPLKGDVLLDSLPVDVVPEFTSAVRNIGGKVSGHVAIGGTVGRPTFNGRLAIDRGSATLVATGTTLRDVTARVHTSGDSITIDSLSARTPATGGRIRLVGSLDRSDPAVSVLAFDLTSNNARIVDTRDLGHVDFNSHLTLSGPLSSPFLYGDATIHNAVYYLPISNGKRLVDINDPTVYVVANLNNPNNKEVIPVTAEYLSRARMTVSMNIERNSWVRSPLANIEIYTVDPLTLRIDRANRAVVVEGTVSTDRGEYTFLSKRFDITKGTATFKGTPTINPDLQGSGGYLVPVPGRQPISIQFIIAGKADSLRLTVSSNAQPPVAQSTLLSYLAFSSPTVGISQETQSSSLTGTGNSGNVVGTASNFVQAQLTSTAIGVLSAEGSGALGRALGADVLNITTGNLYTDVGQHSDAATILQTTQVEYGKYVTPDTYVALQASVAPGGRVVHQVGNNLNLSVSLEPLYLLGPATLSQNTNTPLTGAFGLTLVRTWRF